MNLIAAASGIETLTGSLGDDAYIFEDVSLITRATLVDGGGSDSLVITYGTNTGQIGTSGEFINTGTELIFRTQGGREILFDLDANGNSAIEYLVWRNIANDRIQALTIVTDLDHITGNSIAVAGTTGDDRIVAPEHFAVQSGYSEIYGNAGNDHITLSSTMFMISYGGLGNDTILGRGDMDDSFRGDGGADLLRGAGGSDKINGNVGSDRLFGDAGADQLYGDEGADRVQGGSGADRIDGGTGNDTLTGGTGVDTFVFSLTSGSDRILDWQQGTDLVDLRVFGISSFQALSAALTNLGGDAVLDLTAFGGNGSLTFVGEGGQINGAGFLLA